jgi:DNA-binding PadR family transcriptional regulator
MGSPPRAAIESRLPLKPLVFQILLALANEERHGWSLVREVQQRGGFARLLPGNFYRTLRSMTAEELIEESPKPSSKAVEDERRRYFRATPLGAQVAAAEARRLEAVVIEARSKRLLVRSRS